MRLFLSGISPEDEEGTSRWKDAQPKERNPD